MKLLSFLSLIFITHICFGQQAVSSQFTQIPIELNAGLTGSACGLRVITHFQNLNYKNLENSKFINYGASLDMPINLKNGDKIGIGYSYAGDIAGQTSYSNIGHSLSAAYLKRLGSVEGKPAFISLGLSAGVMNSSLDVSGLRWPSQINAGGFDPTIDPGEEIAASILYPNVNLGLAFKGPITSTISANTGLSIYHINKPNISFLGNETALESRFITYTRFDVLLNSKWSINPSFYYMEHSRQNFYMIGADFTYQINQNKAVSIGGGYGKNDQPYINASANIDRLNIALNYGYSSHVTYKKLECIVGYLITTNKCQ